MQPNSSATLTSGRRGFHARGASYPWNRDDLPGTSRERDYGNEESVGIGRSNIPNRMLQDPFSGTHDGASSFSRQGRYFGLKADRPSNNWKGESVYKSYGQQPGGSGKNWSGKGKGKKNIRS